MSWFSQYVGDPLKALLAKVEAGADADLKALAGQVATQIPAAPITATAETDFETALQTAMDGVITAAVGQVPVVGQTLAPEAVAAGNAAIAYAVSKGTAALNSLAAEARSQLAAFATAPAERNGGAAQPGAVG